MKTVKDILQDPRAVVIFDIDGTLTEYTYGERTLMPRGMDGANLEAMNECTGLREMAKTRDIYSEVEAFPAMSDYIKKHGTDRVFVCSVEMEGREQQKIQMCERLYGIPGNHVCFVQNEAMRAEEKTLVIDHIRRKYFPDLDPKWFVMVDDSSHLLRKMSMISDYSTALVSVFLSYPWTQKASDVAEGADATPRATAIGTKQLAAQAGTPAMRKGNREITDMDEILDIIERCDVVRLGLHQEDVPYILPLNFGYEVVDGELRIYFHSATEGHKINLIRQNNRASFEMDCQHVLQYFEDKGYCTMAYESVMGRGIIEEIEGDENKLPPLELLMKHYHMGEAKYFSHAALPRTKVYVLRVESMTAKRKAMK